MTTIEAIRAELVADATVTGKVAARIYPVVAKQGTAVPFVVLTVVSDVPVNSLDGSQDSRLVNALVQVDAYAKTYLEAQSLGDALDAVLANLSSPDLSATRDSRRDSFEDGADESGLHRCSLDFSVFR